MEHKALKALKELLEHKVFKVQQEYKVLKELPVYKVFKALKEHKA